MGHTDGFGDSVVGQAAASDFPSTHEMQTAVVIVGSIGAAAFLIGAILLMRWACWRGSHQGRARDPATASFAIPAPGASPFLFGGARGGAGPVSRQSGSSEDSCDLKERGSMMIPIVVVSPDDSVSVALSFQSSVKSELPSAVELSAVKLDIEACLDGSPSANMERSHSNESSRSSTSAGFAPMTPQPSTEYAPSLPAGPDGSDSGIAGFNGGEAGSSQCGTVGLHTAPSASPAAAAAAGDGVAARSTQATGEPQLPIGFILRPLAPAAPETSSLAVPHPQPSPLNRAAPAAAVVPRRRPAPIPEDIHPAVRYEEEDRRRRLARADPLTHRSAMSGFALGMMLPCMMF
ncbi:hypothetical protein N2152v2_001525 [Parachlorella kessleri]